MTTFYIYGVLIYKLKWLLNGWDQTQFCTCETKLHKSIYRGNCTKECAAEIAQNWVTFPFTTLRTNCFFIADLWFTCLKIKNGNIMNEEKLAIITGSEKLKKYIFLTIIKK